MSRSERLYEDVAAAGGLAALLRTMVTPPVTARADEPGRPAIVGTTEPGARKTTVYLGSEERVFILEARVDHVPLAGGSVSHPEEAAAWINDFHAGGDVEAALSAHVFMHLSWDGRAYLSGSEVDWWWNYLLDPPPDDTAALPRLLDLVREAARHPVLRQLRPVTSHANLGFSRCTRYPFSSDLPWIRTYAVAHSNDSSRKYHYDVNLPGRKQPLRLAESAAEAAEFAVDLLPPGSGPAIAGTADDLN